MKVVIALTPEQWQTLHDAADAAVFGLTREVNALVDWDEKRRGQLTIALESIRKKVGTAR